MSEKKFRLHIKNFQSLQYCLMSTLKLKSALQGNLTIENYCFLLNLEFKSKNILFCYKTIISTSKMNIFSCLIVIYKYENFKYGKLTVTNMKTNEVNGKLFLGELSEENEDILKASIVAINKIDENYFFVENTQFKKKCNQLFKNFIFQKTIYFVDSLEYLLKVITC